MINLSFAWLAHQAYSWWLWNGNMMMSSVWALKVKSDTSFPTTLSVQEKKKAMERKTSPTGPMHPLQKLVAVPLVRRFSYLPCARLPDHHSAGGEIHSPHAGLPPGWWRYSLTNPMMDFLNAVPPLGRFSYLPHARFSRHHSVGGEILLLALCWTSLFLPLERFSYSPHARLNDCS